jgi:LCP family protein required for cell wall assembly
MGIKRRAGGRSSGGNRALLLATCLLLSNFLLGCGATPTPVTIAEAPTADPSPTPTLSPSSTPTATSSVTPTASPSATPTQTALPVLPTVVPSDTATITATPSRTATATLTPSPAVTPTPSSTPTETNTPGPPTLTITPTETLSPTLTPTLTPTPLYTPTPMPIVEAAQSKDLVTVLLIGLDSRKNLGSQNTDVIIVVVANKKTKQVSMLSIPRDLWVYIPTYGWSRINIAHKIGHRTGYPGGGPGLLMETIKVNFGIPVEHWARIDFTGFTSVIDKLGGVDITVRCPVNLRYAPPDSEEEEEMWLAPGVYHMDGPTALRYVRTRRGGSDFDRSRRQQQFLKAVWYQFRDANLISQVQAVWAGARDAFDTDLGLLDALALAPVAVDVEPERIRNRYIGPAQVTDWTNADGWEVLLPNYPKIQEVVARLYAGGAGDENPAIKEGARIQVRNGTYRPQMALVAADALRWEGLKVVDTSPAENPGYPNTQILVYNSDKPYTVALLAELLDVKPENIIQQPAPEQGVDIRVILGNDYDSCR